MTKSPRYIVVLSSMIQTARAYNLHNRKETFNDARVVKEPSFNTKDNGSILPYLLRKFNDLLSGRKLLAQMRAIKSRLQNLVNCVPLTLTYT